jgi:nitroreductase
MNPRLNVIFSRRSVRKYPDKVIPAAMPPDLLEARTRYRPARVHWERRQ